MTQNSFINLDYKPKRDDLVCEFRVEPAIGIDIEKAADAIAGESSVGTWTWVSTSRPYVSELAAKVFDINGKYIKVAYPIGLFEKDNIAQILSSVAGNIFGMKIIQNLRLEDINLPDGVVKSFRGPKFGIGGVRKILNVAERPLVGTIIKPKIGLQTADHAKVALDAWMGGCDIVKDDENLSSQSFNPFQKRIISTLKARDIAEKRTDEKKIYMPNITAETKKMLDRARNLEKQGCEYAMVDIMTVGWSALQTLIEADLDLVIHAHRAMHAAMTRNPRHGISMLTIAKLARLIGVDQIHIGTIIGKMEGDKDDVIEIEDQIEKRIIAPHSKTHALGEEWMHIKPVFAVCSGGLHPGHIPKLMNLLGKDIIIQAGGGCHGHPNGTREGATALRQSVDAAMEGVSLKNYAMHHKELAVALKKWA